MSLTSDKKLDQFETESPIRAFSTFDVAGRYAVGKGFRPSLQHLPIYLDAMRRKENWKLVQIIEADAPTMIFERSVRVHFLDDKINGSYEAMSGNLNTDEFAKTYTMTFTGQMEAKDIAWEIDKRKNYRVIAALPEGMSYTELLAHLRFFTIVAVNDEGGVYTITAKHINPPKRSGGSEYPHISEDDIHYIGHLYGHPLLLHGHPPRNIVRDARQFLTEKLLPKGVMPELAGRVAGKSPSLGMPYDPETAMAVGPDEAYKVFVESIPTVQDDPVNPKHYDGTACAELGERMTANSYQVLKYNWRLGEKDDELVELDKSIWYLDREIELLPMVPGVNYPDAQWVGERLNAARDEWVREVARSLLAWNRTGKIMHLETLRHYLVGKRAEIVACRERGDCADRGRGLEP